MMTPEKVNCEVCGKEGLIPQDITIHATMPFCKGCLQKELAAEAEIKATANDRIADIKEANLQKEASAMLESLDTTISIKTDVFNATLPSIVELKNTIDNDPTITNKTFELARVVKERFEHLKKVIFDLSQERETAISQQRALVSYLNDLANKLREDEREALKLKDISYKPEKPKAKPEPKKKITVAKFDREDLKKYALELNISMSTLQVICTAKGLSPEEAAKTLKQGLKDAGHNKE